MTIKELIQELMEGDPNGTIDIRVPGEKCEWTTEISEIRHYKWGVEITTGMVAGAQEKPKRESRAMLPCKCGGKRREHWYGSDGHEELRCTKCGFTVKGKNATDVIRQWNKEVSQ